MPSNTIRISVSVVKDVGKCIKEPGIDWSKCHCVSAADMKANNDELREYLKSLETLAPETLWH